MHNKTSYQFTTRIVG